MHDIKAIREDPDAYRRGWASRGVAAADETLTAILGTDRALRAAQTEFQVVQARRNEASKQIGQAKAQGLTSRSEALMAEVEGLKARIADATEAETRLTAELR